MVFSGEVACHYYVIRCYLGAYKYNILAYKRTDGIMSITSYSYQRFKWESLIKCARWTLNDLQMRDWELEVADGNPDPECVGYAKYDINELKATVWVDIARCNRDNVNPYSTLIHEILHIFISYRVGNTDQEVELICRTLEPILYEKFCKENRVKPASKCKTD